MAPMVQVFRKMCLVLTITKRIVDFIDSFREFLSL